MAHAAHFMLECAEDLAGVRIDHSAASVLMLVRLLRDRSPPQSIAVRVREVRQVDLNMLTVVFDRLCLLPPAERSDLRRASVPRTAVAQITPQCASRSADTPMEPHDPGELAPGRHIGLNSGYSRRHGPGSVRVRRAQPIEPRLQPAELRHREADPSPGKPWPVHGYLPSRAASQLTRIVCTSFS